MSKYRVEYAEEGIQVGPDLVPRYNIVDSTDKTVAYAFTEKLAYDISRIYDNEHTSNQE